VALGKVFVENNTQNVLSNSIAGSNAQLYIVGSTDLASGVFERDGILSMISFIALMLLLASFLFYLYLEIANRGIRLGSLFSSAIDVSNSIQQPSVEDKEKRFGALIENHDGIISVLDRNLKVLYRSRSASRITGWSHKEYEEVDAAKFVHPDDIQHLENKMRKAIANPRTPVQVQLRTRHKLGHYQWMEGVINNLLDDKEVKGIVTNIRDVTDRKNATDDLLKSKTQFQNLIENISGVYWTTNLETYQTTYISPSYEKIWGRKCEDLYKNPADFIESVHPEDRTIVTEAHVDIINTRGKTSSYRIVKPDGEIRWISARVNVVVTEGERIEYGYAEDITDQKKAIGENLHLLERNQQIIQSMMDGYLLTDDQGSIIEVNASYSKMIGYSHQELLKMNIRDVLHEVSAEETTRRLNSFLAKGSVQFETAHVRKDGTLVDVEISISARSIEGQPLIAAFIRDISERKKDQALLARQYKAIEEYAFINSHEVRARVATMLGLMNLLRRDYVKGGEKTEVLNHLYNETETLDVTIRKLTVLVSKNGS